MITAMSRLRDMQDEEEEITARESVPFDPSSLLVTLRDLGVVWETASGV